MNMDTQTISPIQTNTLTQGALYALLKANGVKPKSYDWWDYELAKRLISDMPASQIDYDQAIRWIADYVGV